VRFFSKKNDYDTKTTHTHNIISHKFVKMLMIDIKLPLCNVRDKDKI